MPADPPPFHHGAVTDTTTPDPAVDAPPADSAPPTPTPDVLDAPAKLDLTQADLDAIIQREKAKARSAAERELAEAAERAKMDETQRLQAEKADADARATEALTKANERVLQAEAKLAAGAAKVSPERVATFLRLVDLSEVEVGDDGTVDAKALDKAIEAALAVAPEFRTTDAPARGSAGGFDAAAPPARAKGLDAAVAKRLGIGAA